MLTHRWMGQSSQGVSVGGQVNIRVTLVAVVRHSLILLGIPGLAPLQVRLPGTCLVDFISWYSFWH